LKCDCAENNNLIYITYILPGVTKGAPPSSFYESAVERFALSYKKYFPKTNHKLILVNSNGGYNLTIKGFFNGISYETVAYNGSGWDIGGHQFAINSLNSDDWVMCFSTWTYFRQEGWLEAFVDARNTYGEALYGSSASYERHLHLRGTGIFMPCGMMQSYPLICNNKKQSWLVESGSRSLTWWFIKNQKGAYLVTPNGVVGANQFRSLSNIYRRGNQSNLWIYDKHSDIYDNASRIQKIKLEFLADSRVVNLILNIYLMILSR
jgi:hypothetical protein